MVGGWGGGAVGERLIFGSKWRLNHICHVYLPFETNVMRYGGVSGSEVGAERGEECDSAMFALDFLISPGRGWYRRHISRANEETRRYDSAGCRTIFIESVSDPYERAYTPRPTYGAYRSISTLITGPLPVDLNIYRLKRLLRGRL